MFLASLLWLSVGASYLPAEEEWYRVRVDVPNASTLQRLQNSNLDLMECIPHLGTTDVAIGPGDIAELMAGGYSYSYVSKLEDPRNWGEQHSGPHPRVSDEYRLHYFNADQILAFFEQLRAENPTIVTRQNIGTSIKGETMWAYRFVSPAFASSPTLNNFVVEGLIHAREWITGACMMHIGRKAVDTLTHGVGRLMANQALWVIPITNPDGYRYTWTTNRLWRKNRRTNSGGTFGVDLNRNFPKGWGGNNGSSGSPGSETYRGTAAFSEPESQAVRTLLQSLPRVGGFIDYHSYSQIVLAPWGYTTTPPPDAPLLNKIGFDISVQMNGFGATYDEGQTSQILYIASGISNDYVYDVWHQPAYGIELRDTGENGFLLPEDQIFATQDEVWSGLNRFLSIVGP